MEITIDTLGGVSSPIQSPIQSLAASSAARDCIGDCIGEDTLAIKEFISP